MSGWRGRGIIQAMDTVMTTTRLRVGNGVSCSAIGDHRHACETTRIAYAISAGRPYSWDDEGQARDANTAPDALPHHCGFILYPHEVDFPVPTRYERGRQG